MPTNNFITVLLQYFHYFSRQHNLARREGYGALPELAATAYSRWLLSHILFSLR